MTLSTHPSADTSSPVHFANFNQDCTSLAVGTSKGYKLFSLNSVDTLEATHEYDQEEIYIVERLFSSSLVVVVTLKAPRLLKVGHFKKGTWICHYSYSNTILAVKLNRSRLVVSVEGSLYVHNIRDLKVLHTIRDTPPNPSGLLTLSISMENCFLAYPGSGTIGEVQIFDAGHLHAKTMIPAHDSPLAALAFSPSGKELATASEKGTVIRVFSVADGTKLFEFRRGVKRCVSISSLVFSTDANYLCCSSNTETVHIFKLEEPKEPVQEPEDNSGWIGLFTKAVTMSATYLPAQVTDVFSQGRAFASVHLPFQNLRNICAITTIQKVLRLLVVASDGNMYIYNLDGAEGGDCPLIKQHSLVDKEATLRSEDKVDGTQDIGQNPGSISSYAGILKGHATAEMSGIGTDSEKVREMAAAVEAPPEDRFRFDDDSEFPPVTQKTE